MLLSFAPMEGVTNAEYRRVHRRFFPEADRYFAPFLAPFLAPLLTLFRAYAI